MFKYAPSAPRFAHPVIRPDEVPTTDGLALDLSAMDEMRDRGIPIQSSMPPDSFFDGEEGDSMDIAFETRRGVDINDVWNYTKDTREKLTKAKIGLTDVNPK